MTPYNVTNAPERCFNLATRMTNEYHSYEIFDNFAKNGFYSNAEFSQYFCQKMSCTLYKHDMLQNSSRTWVLGNTCGIWNNLCGPSMPHIKKWIFYSPVMYKGVLLSGKWLSRQGFVAYVFSHIIAHINIPAINPLWPCNVIWRDKLGDHWLRHWLVAW